MEGGEDAEQSESGGKINKKGRGFLVEEEEENVFET